MQRFPLTRLALALITNARNTRRRPTTGKHRATTTTAKHRRTV